VIEHKIKTKQLIRDTEYRRTLKEESDEWKSDIYNGGLYKRIAHKTKICGGTSSLIWGDGVRASKSGRSSISPLVHIVNEMDPTTRFQHEKMILQGLWCSQNKIDYELFLNQIIPDWNLLKKGFTIQLDKQKITISHETIGWITDYVEGCKVSFVMRYLHLIRYLVLKKVIVLSARTRVKL
jgi:hypothetical protein